MVQMRFLLHDISKKILELIGFTSLQISQEIETYNYFYLAPKKLKDVNFDYGTFWYIW